MVRDGSPATPVALLAIAVAAPASEFAAPWKPTTVIDAISDWLSTPVTVIDARAVGENAHQISDVPCCVLTRCARVHVSAGALALLFTLLTTTLVPVAGPSVAIKATRSVLPWTANAGLVIVVFGEVAFLDTNVAIVGAAPCETTSATALPAAKLVPAVGVSLMTMPAATVVLGWNVIAPTVRPAPVSDVVAAAWVRPTTLGTVTGGRPLETTRLTAEPTSTVAAAAGSWLMTTPTGTVLLLCCVITPATRPASEMRFSAVPRVVLRPSGRSVTVGTIVPSEITRSTGEFAGRSVPSSGLAAATVPILNTVLLAVVTVPTRRPAWRINVVAAACVRPLTAGTVFSRFGVG